MTYQLYNDVMLKVLLSVYTLNFCGLRRGPLEILFSFNNDLYLISR